MHEICSVSTWWKHLLTAVRMPEHKHLSSQLITQRPTAAAAAHSGTERHSGHLMKHSSHQRNRKINRVYGSTLLLTLLSQTGASLLTGQDTLVTFVMCVLHIAIWVMQTKCRSCKRKKKKTDKYACARDQIRGFFGAISPNSQIWRVICTNNNNKKKIFCQMLTAWLCLASHYKSKTVVLNKPI